MNAEDYKKIISIAINREIESYNFYRGITEKVVDPNLKKLFGELAGDETKHREFLQGVLAKDIRSLKFAPVADYKVGDSLKTPALSMDLKPIDGLVLAIKKELQAMSMYTQLASANVDPEQKKMFTELATMERGHKARLEDLYVEMAFPEAW